MRPHRDLRAWALAATVALVVGACLAPAPPTSSPNDARISASPPASGVASHGPEASAPVGVIADPGRLDVLGGPALVYTPAAGGLVVADADGSDARPLAGADHYLGPRWSPDGQLIAALLVDPRGDRLVVIDRAGARVLDVLSQTGRLRFAWALDDPSHHRLAATLDEGLQILDLDDGTSLDVPLPKERWVSTIAWSTSSPALYWADADGRRPESTITLSAAHVPPGAATAPAPARQVIDVDAGEGRTYRDFEEAAVSPDGSSIAFRARIERWAASHAVIVPLDGAAAWRRDEMLSAWSAGHPGVGWTRDGRAVLGDGVVGEHLTPLVLPVDGSPAVHLVNDPGHDWVVMGQRASSSGGSTILLGRQNGEQFDGMTSGSVMAVDLWTVGEDGSGRRPLAEDVLGADLR